MYREKFVEEGIVADVKDGIATIFVLEAGSCEECGAKIFCRPTDDKRKLSAKDPFGVKPGDKVSVAVRGRNVVAASSIIYGVPLILILAGVFLGMSFFSANKELYSSVLGLGLVALYLFIVYTVSKIKKESEALIPEIVFVSKAQLH
ncbi:MAG: SoxR reducing system RseC family protein [Ignavibacteriaceae bacterium]|nr:SoxR reducing system RseC family protein [Ignavibacteriaceae bacterium]